MRWSGESDEGRLEACSASRRVLSSVIQDILSTHADHEADPVAWLQPLAVPVASLMIVAEHRVFEAIPNVAPVVSYLFVTKLGLTSAYKPIRWASECPSRAVCPPCPRAAVCGPHQATRQQWSGPRPRRCRRGRGSRPRGSGAARASSCSPAGRRSCPPTLGLGDRVSKATRHRPLLGGRN